MLGQQLEWLRELVVAQVVRVIHKPLAHDVYERLLQALRQPAAPQAAIDDIAARIAQLEGSMLSADAGQKPWEGSTYDTFAKYAGEASRVASTGRLPFGSDSKKMAL